MGKETRETHRQPMMSGGHWTTTCAGFFRRRSIDQNVADDLLQETYLRIHSSIGSLNDQGEAWLRGSTGSPAMC